MNHGEASRVIRRGEACLARVHSGRSRRSPRGEGDAGVAPTTCGIALALAIGAAAFSCTPTVDYENVAGIERAEDGVFRSMDYPGATSDEAFQVLEGLFRMHFAGKRLTVDRERRTIETVPLAFTGTPQQVTMYGSAAEIPDGARVELFARVERLRDDLRDNPNSPWKYMGADAKLENLFFEELWDALVVAKRIEDGATK